MIKLNKDSIKDLLEKRFENDKHTKLSLIPPPLAFKDMQKAANRIKTAIEENERIVVVGDYDVDGIVSAVILSEFFDEFGVNYDIYIPNRFSDGYGLNPQVIERIKADVIITVDNGISAIEAAKTCKDKGITLIITDHHTPSNELPDAFAVINPKQNDCDFPINEICGAQVAWYLVAAIKEVCGVKYDLGKFLDLLAIAIIADMMDLTDINRTMAKSGLRVLNQSNRPAFAAIRETFKKECFCSEDISFVISPLLNSSGRMEDAMFSYKFLRSNSRREAQARLNEIILINERRKEEEKTLYETSLQSVKEDDDVIVIWGEEWHEGVIGIVASRLVKRFKKPAVVFSQTGKKAKGSARSVEGIDVLSLISKQSEMLLGFGGHFGAAGLSIESKNLEMFRENINKLAKELKKEEKSIHTDNSLGEIATDAIDFELLEILEEYEPYGQKNPKPIFTLKNMYVKIDKPIGKDRRHKKLVLQFEDGKNIEALFFNCEENVGEGDVIDVTFNVSKNNFKGLITPQLLIKEIYKQAAE